jgi:phosphate transport system substrate-binding protein
MMFQRYFILAITLVLVFFASVNESRAEDPAEEIHIDGSTTLYPSISGVSERYMILHPNVKIKNKQSSSTKGIEMLLSNSVDIARASRPLHDSEIKQFSEQGGVKPFKIGLDAIVLIVNSSKESFLRKELTQKQVKAIFFDGTINKWSQIDPKLPGKINVYIRDEKDSGTSEMFEGSILGKEKKPYVKSARKITISTELIPTVAKDPDAISYAPFTFLRGEVFAVPYGEGKEAAVGCNVQTIRDRTYALSRDLFVIARLPLKLKNTEFIDFALSDEGQKIMEEKGIIPVR